MSNRRFALTLHLNMLPWLLLAFVVPSLAQPKRPFQWRFDNNFLSPSLPSCLPLSIFVEPLDHAPTNATGKPPYYMIAFVPGGTPVTTFIGTDHNNLSWKVTEPVGSRVALNVVDSNGDYGGIPPTIYTVIAGQSTQCITTSPAIKEFKMTTNVTGDLSTCQPWGFTITGGAPPYTLTLSTVGSPNITNATIGYGDDAFIYINRAPPGNPFLGAVSDLTGRWAHGTAIVNTIGSTDTLCTGLRSVSGNSTIIQSQPDTGTQSKQRHINIIAVSLTLSLLFIIGLGIAGFLYLRKLKKQADAEFQEIAARPFGGPEGGSLVSITSIQHYPSAPSKEISRDAIAAGTAGSAPARPSSMPPIYSPTAQAFSVPRHKHSQESQVREDRPFSVSDYSSFEDTSTISPGSMYSLPSFANFPLTSIRAPQNSSREPGERTGVDNQIRTASSDEAEIDEPALTDAESNVLPRSSSATVRTGRSRIINGKVRLVRGCSSAALS